LVEDYGYKGCYLTRYAEFSIGLDFDVWKPGKDNGHAVIAYCIETPCASYGRMVH
jgi:hypothetical protein